MRKARWVGRCSWGAEEKREMFGVKTEGFVALRTACHTAGWSPASATLRLLLLLLHCAKPGAARDRLCWFSVGAGEGGVLG